MWGSWDKKSICIHDNHFGIPNGTRKFPKYHCATWSDVIYFSPVDYPIPNPVIQSRHVGILRYPYWYGMSPVTKNSINTMSNRVSNRIAWSILCASREHEFYNWQCAQALMKWTTPLWIISHKNSANILNKVTWSCMFPDTEDTWHDDITTCMNLSGTTIRLSCPTLNVRRAS